jgi:hypothetical protein
VLGRPTSMRTTPGTRGVSCDVRWSRIGLTIKFVTFGGVSGCVGGFVQTATVDTAHAGDWVALIEGRPAVAPGTSIDFLTERSLAEQLDGYFGPVWALASTYVPYGDGGAMPAVSARLGGGGKIVGFGAWIGGAGD